MDLTGYNKVQDKNEELENAQRNYTGLTGARNAYNAGQAGALSVGQNAGVNTANVATSAGASKGEAAALGQNAANIESQNAVAEETSKAADANNALIKDKEKQLQEAEAESAEKQATIGKVGNVLNTLGTTALTAAGTALGGPVGGAIGAGLGGAVGAGRTALQSGWGNSSNKLKRGIANIGSLLLSDERKKVIEERCGYKSKVYNDALFHLLDDLENASEAKLDEDNNDKS